MSTIKKLQIRGIRSFGIESGDVQKLNFTSPLTLIVGENGCGKTTVIECLKYGLTGDLPPGSNRGQSFVHDPKIFDATECLGQVKIMVRDLKNNELTCTRSMKTTQKKNQLKFGTLDSVLAYRNTTTGKEETITHRCADVDTEMCTAMGVSKAIINNVIFCHQEDSNWPLDEGKKLKEKFDAIFGTTEYNKAIDKIIKLRKKTMDNHKEKVLELKLLEHIKGDTEKKIMEKHNCESKLQKFQVESKEFDNLRKPIEDRLFKITEDEKQIGKLQALRVESSTKLEECKKQQESLRRKIKKIFNGSQMELEHELVTFQQKISQQNAELKSSEQKLIVLKNEESTLQNKIANIEQSFQSLSNDRKREQDLIAERAKYMIDLCTTLEIPVNADDVEHYSRDEIRNLLQDITRRLTAKENALKELAKEHDAADVQAQNKIDRIRREKTVFENTFDVKNKQISEMRTEHIEKTKNKTKIETDGKKLDNLLEQIERKNKEYEEYSNEHKLDEMKENLGKKKEKRNKMQTQLEKLDKDIAFLNSISKITVQLQMKEQQLELKSNELKRLKNKHLSNFKTLFAHPIESNFKRIISNKQEGLQRKINELNESIKSNENEKIRIQYDRKSKMTQLEKNEKELKSLVSSINRLCEGESYDTKVEKLKATIEKMNQKYGTITNSDVLYKRYIENIDEDSCCPLCHKDMTSLDVTDLKQELSEKIEQLPDEISKMKLVLDRDQVLLENLIALRPQIVKSESLGIDIQQLKDQIEESDLLLATKKSTIDQISEQITSPEAHIKLISGMIGDMSVMDERAREITNLTAEIDELKQKIPDEVNEMNMEDIEIERSMVAEELKVERNAIDTTEAEIDKVANFLHKLRAECDRLRDEKLKLQEAVQTLSQLNNRLLEIRSLLEKTKPEIEALGVSLKAANEALAKAVKEKDQLKIDNRESMTKEQTAFNAVTLEMTNVKRCEVEIESLNKRKLQENMQKLREQIAILLTDREEKTLNIQSKVKIIENIKTEITNQESDERNLNDNLELMKIITKEKEHACLLEQLIKDIGDLDFRKMTAEKTKLLNRQNELLSNQSKIEGQMSELRNQINAYEKELQLPKYKNSLINYRRMQNEVDVYAAMASDLGKYRAAIDMSLMKFHSEKMQQINQTIRELWHQIYQGNDINYIEIISEDGKETGQEKKRSYNYRVVQLKNDKKIDMRGRCSAGQKVLASLIIRMALAETFSSNCGILALDEPTTNLDEKNVTSLCNALSAIIEERQANSNFMLIVITHDEKFIKLLHKVHQYYRLSRTPYGKSVIELVSV